MNERFRAILLCGAFLLGAITSPHAFCDDDTPSSFDADAVVSLLELVIDADAETAQKCLGVLTEKIQSGEVSAQQMNVLRPRLQETIDPILKGDANDPLYFDTAMLSASWQHPTGVSVAKTIAGQTTETDERRTRAVRSLVAAGDPAALQVVSHALADSKANSATFRVAALTAISRLDDPMVAKTVLTNYEHMDEELKPKAIEMLTERPAWSKMLLEWIGRGTISRDVLNVNQVTKLLASPDEALRKLVTAEWGTVRTERDPAREQLVAKMHELIANTPGDALRGRLVFNKLCGQCHKIYGEGQEVGPDITSNGRASFEQLLSNVFDPSLVIGASYQARTVITADGRVLSGLLVEENDQRVVLKVQGGKLEVIPRDDVDELLVSKLSLMPEGIENQLKPQEIADLFEFLTLDGPLDDPKSRYIPGTPERASQQPERR